MAMEAAAADEQEQEDGVMEEETKLTQMILD